MPPKLTISQRARKLATIKDKLRDDLDDIKILVRRSFGSISTELADLEVALVEGCIELQEVCMLQRVLGASGQNRRHSIHGVFQAIDTMHRTMEEVGIRRKRHNGLSQGATLSQQLSTPESTEGMDAELEVVAGDVEADGDPSRALPDAKATTNSTLTQDALTNKRTTAFSQDNVFSVSPFALDLACQLRLSTLASIRDEVFTGAMLAQRKLVAAKRWVPDAPCPLAASVDGLINEILAMKKQLLVESPSMSVASLPMVQYPLASINIKQMKQQQQQRTGSPPRQTTSPRPVPAASPSLNRNSIVLHASRAGTAFVEGAEAEVILAERPARSHSMRLKKFYLESNTSQGRRGPLSPPPISPTENNLPLEQQLSSDDVQRLLRSVKAELQKQPVAQTMVSLCRRPNVPTKFNSSPLCKTPSSKSRQGTPALLTSPMQYKTPLRTAATPGPNGAEHHPALIALYPQRSLSRGGIATRN
ncbi:Hypothetical protein, putative [Bodo saltans]|uniref:Uncharacterized protein n=1 Tax=Bodo saltans TaxID=75058 RepID=A0A0S4IQI2_BODSA|nr:Hypothetical protein, putative [Bodo saltans]|eukprot:CUF96051.1 Hypothetical protein, putative [Bodo saltans]